MSANTDESSYSQTSYEDSSTMNLDQSFSEHTYSADKIQQSSIKRNLLSTHSSAFNSNNNISNEKDGSSYTSPSSSEGACMLDIINSEPLAFVSPSPPPNSTSVFKNQTGKDLVFVKRGAKRRRQLL